MRLDLREIIDVPGREVPFEQDLDVENLEFSSVARYVEPPRAAGKVRNSAGVLRIEGEINASMICTCDRCGAEFPSEKRLGVDLVAVAGEEPDNPSAFSLDGDWLDMDEVLETAFVLDMETKFLCDPDCKGFCPECGKNLNEGPCSCRKKSDPRLAVLEQLLDNKE